MHFISVDNTAIAYHHQVGTQSLGLMWLGGYRSDMQGTKAIEIEAFARENDLSSTRHDYSGHGQSGGAFKDGTISLWLKQSLAVLDQVTAGPQILVGSSMGAWIALRMVEMLATRGQASKIAGLLLLAPAPDFTVELMEPHFTDAQRSDLAAKGFFEEPTPYGPEPNIFTQAFFDDGRQNQVMHKSIDTHCPVHIIQGMADHDVPWQHAQRLFELLPKDDASITYVKDGDHRLSRPEDIALIKRVLTDMIGHGHGLKL
ncbi:MAG: alpha/beta hydrolase [Ahrensia sp.]|nr:alpha/beta hydrolase [Ahrensia sp.]